MMMQNMQASEILKCVEKNGVGIVDAMVLTSMEDVVSGMLTGDLVFFIDGFYGAYKIPVKGYPNMGVTENTAEPNIRGSKEGFADSVKTNTALIRKRVRSNKLKVKEIMEGVRSNTTIALCYIEDIVAPNLVEEIEQYLNQYEIDGF